MAAINIFHYLPGNSVIHRIDTRIKLVCMIMLSITTSLMGRVWDYLFLTIILLLFFWLSGMPVPRLLKELKYFHLLILMIIGIQAFSLPPAPGAFIPIPGFTLAGLKSGLLLGWRLVVIVIICLLFTGTTQISSLRRAVEWFLHFIPGLPAARIGTMFSLTFVIIPLIFDRAAEISDAQKARCVSGRKNPWQRISFMVFPLLRRTFEQADEMAMAMESRCYSEVYRKTAMKTSGYDWMALGFTALVCGFLFLL